MTEKSTNRFEVLKQVVDQIMAWQEGFQTVAVNAEELLTPHRREFAKDKILVGALTVTAGSGNLPDNQEFSSKVGALAVNEMSLRVMLLRLLQQLPDVAARAGYVDTARHLTILSIMTEEMWEGANAILTKSKELANDVLIDTTRKSFIDRMAEDLGIDIHPHRKDDPHAEQG